MRPGARGLVRRARDWRRRWSGRAPTGSCPVRSELRDLLPGHGLRRGSTIAITGDEPGAPSLLLALLAEASRTGSWCAVVGLPALGLVAAAELGIALDRTSRRTEPGTAVGHPWSLLLLDGFDVVVATTGTPPENRVTAAMAGASLAARARQSGSVLVPVGAGWAAPRSPLSPASTAGTAVGETATRRMTVTARAGSAARRAGPGSGAGRPPSSRTTRLRSIHCGRGRHCKPGALAVSR